MIVDRPIGAVKIGNMSHRLTVGKIVPDVVLEFWESTGQIESLKKSGAISDEISDGKRKEKKKSGNEDEFFFQTKER